MPEEPVKHDSQPHSGGADIATGPAKDPGLPTKSPTLRSGASHYDTDEVILRAETLSKVEAKVTSQAIKVARPHFALKLSEMERRCRGS